MLLKEHLQNELERDTHNTEKERERGRDVLIENTDMVLVRSHFLLA